MTGGGAPGAAGVLRCLKLRPELDIIVGDANPKSAGALLHENFILLPHADDHDFLTKLKEIAKFHKIDIIFPLVTKELPLFAIAKQDFEAFGTKILVSDEIALNIANDKLELYKKLIETSDDIPLFESVSNIEMIHRAARRMGHPHNPVVFKLAVSNGSRGIRVIDDQRDRFDMLLFQKPNSIFTSLAEISTVIGDKPLPSAMICEYLPGEEITVDTVCHDGIMKICLIRTRDRINSGISQAGRFICDKTIEQSASNIIRTLGLSGPIGLQYKKDKNGKYKLLEINPRIQGTSVASLGLNINLPLIAIDLLLYGEANFDDRRSGIGFIRYYREAYFDF